jgi:hypothetical protein
MHSLGWTERVQDYFGKRAGPFCIKVAAMLADRVKEPGADDPLRFGVDDRLGMTSDGQKQGIRNPEPEAGEGSSE